MFGLFSKKNKGLVVHDKVWKSDKAKFDACIEWEKTDPNVLFVAWFDETKNKLQAHFEEKNLIEEVYLADKLGLMQQDKNFIFIEHHPLQAEEQRIATHFGKKEITVFSSLEEPIFQLFGSNRIIGMLENLGMKDDEMIEHSFITKSIIKAQEKIAANSTVNVSAKSQQEWFSNANMKKF